MTKEERNKIDEEYFSTFEFITKISAEMYMSGYLTGLKEGQKNWLEKVDFKKITKKFMKDSRGEMEKIVKAIIDKEG